MLTRTLTLQLDYFEQDLLDWLTATDHAHELRHLRPEWLDDPATQDERITVSDPQSANSVSVTGNVIKLPTADDPTVVVATFIGDSGWDHYISTFFPEHFSDHPPVAFEQYGFLVFQKPSSTKVQTVRCVAVIFDDDDFDMSQRPSEPCYAHEEPDALRRIVQAAQKLLA